MNNNADLNSYICILLVSNMAGTIERISVLASCPPPVFGQGTCDKPVENVCLSLLFYSLCISLWGGIRWRSTAYIPPFIYICVSTAVKKCWTYFNDPQNKNTYQVCLPTLSRYKMIQASFVCLWTCFGIYLASLYLTFDTSCYCCLACQIITSGSPEFPALTLIRKLCNYYYLPIRFLWLYLTNFAFPLYAQYISIYSMEIILVILCASFLESFKLFTSLLRSVGASWNAI